MRWYCVAILWCLLLVMGFAFGCGGGGGGSSTGITVTTDDTGTTTNSKIEAGVTDETGSVTLDVGDTQLTFKFLDPVTANPVPGLTVGAGISSVDPGVAALFVTDPEDQYATQIIIVSGTAAAKLDAIRAQETGNPISIDMTKFGTSVLKDITTDQLPIPEKVLTETVSLVADVAMLGFKAVDQLGLPVSEGIRGLGWESVTVEEMTPDEAMAKIKSDAATGAAAKAFLLAFGVAPGAAGIVVDTLNFSLDSQAVLALDETPGPGERTVVVTTLGPLTFYDCELRPVTTEGLVRVPISAVDQYGIPLGEGSLELISTENLGEFQIASIDSNGEAVVDIPAGTYQVNTEALGYTGESMTTTVSDETPVQVTVDQATSFSLRISPTTATVKNGSTVQFTATAQDVTGADASCDPAFILIEGSSSGVAILNSTTGVLTMQKDSGSVQVAARYNGQLSNVVQVTAAPADSGGGATGLTLSTKNLTIPGRICFDAPCEISDTIVVTSSSPWTAGTDRCFDPVESFSRDFSLCPSSGQAGSTTVTVSTMIYGESTPAYMDELLTRSNYVGIENDEGDYVRLWVTVELPYYANN